MVYEEEMKQLPNRLTFLRIGLSTIYFLILAVFIHFEVEGGFGQKTGWLLGNTALGLLVVAIVTDFLDGYLARKWEITSEFGRFVDPLADKILICGSFVMFLELPVIQAFIHGWMVVIIVSREFLVQSIRTHFEQKGIAFGASIWGKMKMVVQSICVVFLLSFPLFLEGFHFAEVLCSILVWGMVFCTVASGTSYVIRALRLVGSSE